MLAVFSVALAVLLSLSMLSAVQGLGPNNGTLAGAVTDADTGEPIEGALVTIEYHSITRTDYTDTNGQYEFKGVPICFCLKDVTASMKGYEAQTQSVGVNAYTIVDFALEPVDDGGDDAKFGILTGTVYDNHNREPLSDVLMTLKYHEEVRTTLTDANGGYTFEDVPLCFCLKNISASLEHYRPESKDVGVSTVTVVDFELMIEEMEPPMGTITGTVTDIHNGNPLGKVLIELTYHDVLRTVYTDADGRYTFDQVPECRCFKTVKASLEHFRPESQDVSVHGVVVVDFALMIEEQEPPSGPSTRTVTDKHAGAPIEGANVELEYNDHVRETFTDADGKYRFDDVPEAFGLKNIKVTKKAFRPESKEVAVKGDIVVDFALMIEEMEPPQDEGTLTGTVTDSSTGMAIEGALVILKHDGITLTSLTDADGRYEITGVPLCFCLKDVAVTMDGYEMQSAQLAIGELTVQDFALEPDDGGQGSIKGRIDSGEAAIGPAVQGVVLLGLVGALVAVLLVVVSMRKVKD